MKQTFYSVFLVLLIMFALVSCSDDEVNNISGDNLQKKMQGVWIMEGNTTKLKIEFTNTIVIFSQPWIGNENTYASYGSFVIHSINGNTVSILDYDNNLVYFSAQIFSNILSINGLNTIKVFEEPYGPRDFQFWNGRYASFE